MNEHSRTREKTYCKKQHSIHGNGSVTRRKRQSETGMVMK